MINIINNTAKQRLLIELTLLQQNLEKNFSKDISAILRRQFTKAAKLIEEFRVLEVYIAVDSERFNFIDVMRKHYRKIAKVFYDRFFSDVNKNFINYETKSNLEEFWQELERYIGVVSLNKVQWIDLQTKKMLRSIINKGLENGKSYLEIAKNLKETGKIQEKWRANRIARTETHSAAVHSLNHAAKTTRIVQEKEWVSAIDSRTRQSPFNHFINERVRMNDFYKKTGENLLYPGDSLNGSKGNIINCRCVELYHTNYQVEEVMLNG